MHLLCTLGSSFAVVPEAYLMGNGDACYESVTVLTTTGTAPAVEKCQHWFAEHAPGCSLRMLVIEDLPDITKSADHERFQEALFRTFAHLFNQQGVSQIHLCLAGGFKTISSSAHQAADLFGCAKLFHITAPSSTEEHPTHRELFAFIEASLAEKKLPPYLNLVDLGSRPGWPTIQQLSAEAPSLPPLEEPFLITDTGFQQKVLNRLHEANRLSQSEHELATLPFPQIARWPPAARDWLQGALDPEKDREWILSLPKIELHCHLGGFATHGDLLQQVRDAARGKLPDMRRDCQHPPDWPSPSQPFGLEPYRKLGDNNGSKLLKDPGCLKKHIELLYQHFQEQNIHYAEVRCSPANYSSEGRSPWTVLSDIIDHFGRCQANAQAIEKPDTSAPHINLIIIATRQDSGDFRTGISKHLALATAAADHWTEPRRPRVVGVDLAGYESRETRAHYFREEFAAAHRAGLGITVHAGENDDAEGIWSAILDLNARRLGHALHLLDSEMLLKNVADRKIGIEMCPYANYQIVGFDPMPDRSKYPLLDYLKRGIPVTINTDNIGISAASLSDNLLFLSTLCPGITRLHALQLLRNSVDQSFAGRLTENALLARIQLPMQSQLSL